MTHPALVLKDRVNELAAELLQTPTGDPKARRSFERHLWSVRSAVRAYTRGEPATPADWFVDQAIAIEGLRNALEAHNKRMRSQREESS